MSPLPIDWISGTTALRSALRKAGVTTFISTWAPFLRPSSYEARVDEALASTIRPGDCVWDVGANVGLYTERFAKAVGSTGRVFAFEPIVTTHAALRERVGSFPHVQTLNVALGSKQDELVLALDADPTSPTNSLTHQRSTGQTQKVIVHAGDDLLEAGKVSIPNVVKIDTEGFEEDVLWGMRQTLQAPQLRAVLIEVHFALLEARGHRRAPERICTTLRDYGFTLRWVDPSHVLAQRASDRG